MNNVWFTSDLHFGHKNIVKFTNRGVDTTEEYHDEWLIDLWNSTVHKSDIIYHLGDFSFHKKLDTTLSILNRLHGNKILLKGNHDHSENFNGYTLAKNTRTEVYLEKRFSHGDNTSAHICMFHFPIGSWHKQAHGSWHLHGHSHGGYRDSKGKMLDVGIDNAYLLTDKHQLFSLEMIRKIMIQKESYVADSHRENL